MNFCQVNSSRMHILKLSKTEEYLLGERPDVRIVSMVSVNQ
jgi:hypothetical protein